MKKTTQYLNVIPTQRTALAAAFATLLGLAANTASAACLTSEAENNNQESSANSGMCSDVRVDGSMSNRSDVDWFSFNTSATGSINITLDHNSRDDFDWALYGTSGGALLRKETSSIPETGVYSNAPAGQYFVKVTAYKGSGWYELTSQFTQGSDGGGSGSDCGYGAAPSAPANLSHPRVGAASDACVTLNSGKGAVLLMGGGSDVDAAFSNRVKNHVGSGADVVVLRTSGTDAYNSYLSGLMSADSVETLIIDNRTKANSEYVDWAIRSAEFVWITGGDQSDYLNQWAGTKTQAAIQHVFDKGGVIGGTSAGMAVLAGTVYDPDGVAGAVSSEVVTDFCHNTLNYSSTFINIPLLNNVITDTHFYERDRMGRLSVFLANNAQHSGVAASEGTSIFIDENGLGTVDGSYEVYVLKETANTQRTQLSCGKPVIYSGLQRIKLVSGQTYNFTNGAHNGQTLTIGVDGRNATFYSPSSVY